MKKYFLIVALGIISFGLTMTSCSKEEDDAPVVDVRTQAVGNYDGDVYLYLSTDTQTADTTWSQDFSIAKNADNSLSIDFVIDGNVEFKGSKIAEASNGFTFDIENQTFVEDGDTYTISGTDFVELNGTKYHGAYETSSKEIGAAFNITINGEDFIMLFGGVKK